MSGFSSSRSVLRMNPETELGSQMRSEQLTVHEFLSRLVTDERAKAEFDSAPQASLDHAGLGDMSAVDLKQSASLYFDHAPFDVVEEYGQALYGSVTKFVATTHHLALDDLHPAPETDFDMNGLHTPDFRAEGDFDGEQTALSGNAVGTDHEFHASATGGEAPDLGTGDFDDSSDHTFDTVGEATYPVDMIDNTLGGLGDVADETPALPTAPDAGELANALPEAHLPSLPIATTYDVPEVHSFIEYPQI